MNSALGHRAAAISTPLSFDPKEHVYKGGISFLHCCEVSESIHLNADAVHSKFVYRTMTELAKGVLLKYRSSSAHGRYTNVHVHGTCTYMYFMLNTRYTIMYLQEVTMLH